jgi:Ser/Thr protein kinase RdoA (MazF antagonist)
MNFGRKQVIHGDLNFHNIIFDKETQTPVILDFEDCNHSFFSPLYDIAMLLERYVLLKHIGDNQKYKLGISLLSHFDKTYFYGDQLYNMLLFISVRSLLILATIFYQKDTVNKKELQKFIDHIKNIEQSKKLLNKIQREILE